MLVVGYWNMRRWAVSGLAAVAMLGALDGLVARDERALIGIALAFSIRAACFAPGLLRWRSFTR